MKLWNFGILLLLLLLLFGSCSMNNMSIKYGQTTCINGLDHTKNGDKYSIITMTQQDKNWEWNASNMMYEVKGKEFTTVSFGTKYHIRKEVGWWFVDGGLGLRFTTVNRNNPFLADSPLLGDISLSTGIKKKFDNFILELSYSLQHLSVPGRSDKGLNYDQIVLGIRIPF